MARTNKRYTAEFKEGAIKMALNSPSVTSVAKNLGIPDATLNTWVRHAKKIGQVEVSTSNDKVNNVDISEVIDENLELKKRVARLEQEKAILKKAL